MHDPPSKKLKLSATSTCSTTDTLSESTYATNLSPNTSLDTMLSASSSPATCTSSATSGPVSQVNDEATPCPTPNDPVSHTPPQPAKCERCEKYSKKTRSLSKKHNRLKKKYAKLENKLKELQTVQVCFFFQLVCQCDENDFMNRCVIKRIQLNIFPFSPKN